MCRRRCRVGHPVDVIEHRTHHEHECDARCRPHACKPLAASSIRQCHAILSGAFSAAVRWGWIAFNPIKAAQKPRAKAPEPDPPTAAETARIVEAAWAEDEDWGMFVWMTLVTGARRGEVIALRWEDVDLTSGVLTIRHSASERDGAGVRIKDTKTHQTRRISLDAQTVSLLAAHRVRVAQRCQDLGAGFDGRRFVFSYAPDHTRACSPSGISHRYARMVAGLGIRTRLHSMRHYSATDSSQLGWTCVRWPGAWDMEAAERRRSRCTQRGSPKRTSMHLNCLHPAFQCRGARTSSEQPRTPTRAASRRPGVARPRGGLRAALNAPRHNSCSSAPGSSRGSPFGGRWDAAPCSPHDRDTPTRSASRSPARPART